MSIEINIKIYKYMESKLFTKPKLFTKSRILFLIVVFVVVSVPLIYRKLAILLN